MARRLRLRLEQRLERLEESALLYVSGFRQQQPVDSDPEAVAAVLEAIEPFGDEFIAGLIGDENARVLLESNGPSNDAPA